MNEVSKQEEFPDMPKSSKALQDAIAEIEAKESLKPKPTKEEELANIRKEIIESDPANNPNWQNLKEHQVNNKKK